MATKAKPDTGRAFTFEQTEALVNLNRKAGLLKLAIYGTSTEGPNDPGQVGLEELRPTWRTDWRP